MKKMNKTFKRIAIITSASLLAACAMVPATMSASAFNVTITNSSNGTSAGTTNNDDGIHTYEAYQVFKGDFANGVLSNIQWGDNIVTTNLITNLKKITAFADLEDEATAKDVADILAANNGTDGAVAKAFAKFIASYVKGTPAISEDGKITDLSNGYYLIQDSSNPTLGNGTVDNSGAQTRFILAVLGKDTTVYTKNDAPSVVKKVQENTDVSDYVENEEFYEDYNDVADYCIGATVPFMLEATLPSNFGDYSAYYLKFTDTLANGFVAPNANNIKIYVDGVEATTSVYNVHKDIKGQEITITIEDVNALAENVAAGSKITVKYDAVLDTDADVGLDGNENKVKLEYSSNPNIEWKPKTDAPNGDEEETEEGTKPETPDVPDNPDTPDINESEDNTGETPEDKVIVFTYELDVTKYLGEIAEGKEAEVGQAGFKLYNASGQAAIIDETTGRINGWVTEKAAVGEEGDADYVAAVSGYEFFTKADGLLNFIGLDDGTYTLKETTTPGGYNTMSDLVIKVDATTANGQSWTGVPSDALTDLELKDADGKYLDGTANAGDNTDGILAHSIVNKAGNTLPGTGGIGTTIFYLGGGVMATIGGVYLISKRRMKKSEE